MELSEIIIQKTNEKGPISFQEFMEICLYYPGLGYYMSPRDPIGPGGDFYTSVSLTPVFGAMIARQLEEMWYILGQEPFTIVEYGAGNGFLCRDILAYLKGNKRMYDLLQYRIIEKSPALQAIEKRHLNEKVCWHLSIEEFSGIQGCVISNELVDNFSVHQVVMEDELMEVFVDYQDGFVETLQPADQELKDYLLELKIELPRGFRTEINLQAIDWISEVSAALDSGYVMTIDYGYQSSELYKPCRSRGTLLSYYMHSVSEALYNNIGKQDITAHVNFSALSHWGIKNGLSDCGFTDQCHFLLGLGVKDAINQSMSEEKDIVKAAKAASFLTQHLLIDMGSKFKVLIQEKGGCPKELSGLKHAYESDLVNS